MYSSAEYIGDVIHLGYKYHVKACVDACAQILKNDLTGENVCVVLAHAIPCNQNEVIKVCEKYILVNTASVFKSAGFSECDKEVLAHIMKMNVLSCTEIEMFEGCMAWVRAKAERTVLTKTMVEKYLGELYYEFRFASMTMQQLCQLSSKYSLVLPKHFEAIARVIVEPEFWSSKFSKLPRHAVWDADAIVKCNRARGNENMSIRLTIKSETTFSTNQPILLGKFECGKIGYNGFLQHDLRSHLSVDVEIIETTDLDGANAKSLLKMMTQLESSTH